MTTSTHTRRPQAGPPPLAPAAAFGALTIAAALVLASAPRASTAPGAALRYAQAHTGQLNAGALLVFGAAIPLAVWTATAYRRLRTLGVTASGAVIALLGGTLAAASLSLSGLVTWVLADSAGAVTPGLAHVLIDLSFAAGAAGFVVPLALLLAGVAVPALLLRLVPRPLAWAGLAIAAVGMLSTFTLLTSALDLTLPIGRFGALVWIIAMSVALPVTRHRASTGPADSSARAAAAV